MIKEYFKEANPIQFVKFDSTKSKADYADFLKDDINDQVSFEDGKIKVETNWGSTYEGQDGYVLVKYDKGDYNLVEPSIFEKTYKILDENEAVKVSTVEAIQIDFTKEDGIKEFVFFVGAKNIDFGDDGDIELKTLEGNSKLKNGDYVLKGVDGEFYPNSKEYFEANYKEKGSEDETEKSIDSNETNNNEELEDYSYFNDYENSNRNSF